MSRARVLLFLAVAVVPLRAQFQVSVPQGDIERPVVSGYDFGLVPAGDPRDVVFRVRNISSSAATLESLSITGPVFTILDPPELPRQVESGAYFDFTVRFQPPATGLYSNALRINALSPILRGTGMASLSVFLDQDGNLTPLTSASTVDFGEIERKALATRGIVLRNQTAQRLAAGRIAVSGGSFRLGPQTVPEALEAGESAAFEVQIEAQTAGVQQGTLEVDGRRIVLRADVVEPPLPRPRISLDPEAPASARQVRLAVRFDGQARTSGAGRVALEFRPAVEGTPADPAIIFPSTNSTAAGFIVTEGLSAARFGDREQIEFQTGTTAGTLTVRVELGSHTEQASLEIAPSPVGLDVTRGTRAGNNLEVYVAGFDNTRTAGQLTFTFYDQSGGVIGSTIRADARAEFERYFESSQVGGVFSLRAVFPVTGDVSRIGGVELEVANSAGTARSARIPF